MKKKLLCWLLILMVALSFAACNAPENDDDNNGEQLPSGDESQYVAPDFGEKGYVDHVFHGLGNLKNDTTYCQTLISSLDELQAFRSSSQVPVTITEYVNSSTERVGMNNTLDKYGSKYFEEGSLVVMLWQAASGEYSFTVKDVDIKENTLNVTLQRWQYLGGHQAFVQWGAIIEYRKSNVDNLNVVTQTYKQQMRASGVGLNLCLTHEVSLETIYHDFTAEDFPELDFEFIVEDFSTELRDKVRQLLVEEPDDYWNRETVNSFTRILVIRLTVENKDNVLRALELLAQRGEIEEVEPIYEFFFEID